jgi:crossover junction endodeoxyribonuclease RusA|tara:strand:- start:330 stop:788 length:459 start_codon:yes stop_codon:yes gene_type:complete
MDKIFIPVRGVPAPQGSKRHIGHGIMIENSKKVKPWRQDVRAAAIDHYEGGIIGRAVEVEIIFLFARPKSHYGTGKNANKLKQKAPEFVTSSATGDIDKLCRSTLDGLSAKAGGTVIKDDSLVVSLKAVKKYAKEGELLGAKISVTPFILSY